MSTDHANNNLRVSDVKRDAEGKWFDILVSLGIDRKYLTAKPGPCPICNDGRDRFKFDDHGEGRWLCSQCPPFSGQKMASGDGLDLLQKVKGWKLREALAEVAARTGTARPRPVRVRLGPDEDKIRAECRDIWTQTKPLQEVAATRAWWINRVGRVPELNDVRAREALACPREGFHPAMVAMFRPPQDGAKGAKLHRTYLTPTGHKADVREPRMLMPGTMPEGGAVRLMAPADGQLGIAEGIETAVAAFELFGIPCWSALNALNIEKWAPPPGLRIWVFGDNDLNFQGQKSAYALAHRLSREKIAVEVRVPEKPGDDWNDVLLNKLSRSVAA